MTPLCELRLFIQIERATGVSINNPATNNNTDDIGRRTKIMKSPPEIIKDCCIERSSIGPRIMDRTKGAAGNLAFRIRYPKTPKTTMAPTSKAV